MKKAFLSSCLIFMLTSCLVVTESTPTVTSIPTDTPVPTSTPLPTNTPSPTITLTQTATQDCSVGNTIENLRRIIPYETYYLSYYSFMGVRFLLYWMVDPAIDPMASTVELKNNFNLGVKHSMELAQKMIREDACIPYLFDVVNPVVVDKYYNGWFSGVFNIKDIPLSELTESDITKLMEFAIDKGMWQRTAITKVREIPSDSCTWNEVLGNVSRHFYNENNLTFYSLVADNLGVTFTVQTQARDDVDSIVAYMNVAREVTCLKPAVEVIIIVLVDETGEYMDVKRYEMP
ncbi:MAG: hypothetical protein ABFD58_08980 [Anaerolineaceae bacterium]